jgi:hypothetical protein
MLPFTLHLSNTNDPADLFIRQEEETSVADHIQILLSQLNQDQKRVVNVVITS